jgi:serine/threonine-protein kinase RsbW
MDQVVELEIPARPEFVGVARMAISALAGIRPGLAYERVDDLRIVVSEACTSAIETAGRTGVADARLRLRCHDDPDRLEVSIEGPPDFFDDHLTEGGGDDDGLRILLIRALVDESEVRSSTTASELRLVMLRRGDDHGAEH